MSSEAAGPTFAARNRRKAARCPSNCSVKASARSVEIVGFAIAGIISNLLIGAAFHPEMEGRFRLLWLCFAAVHLHSAHVALHPLHCADLHLYISSIYDPSFREHYPE